jgi:hypothetical protein
VDATSRVGDRAHARHASSYHDADCTFAFAVETHAMRCHCRRTSLDECLEHLEELLLVDGTAT